MQTEVRGIPVKQRKCFFLLSEGSNTGTDCPREILESQLEIFGT